MDSTDTFDILTQNYPSVPVVLNWVDDLLKSRYSNITYISDWDRLNGSDKVYTLNTHFLKIYVYYDKNIDCSCVTIEIIDNNHYNMISNCYSIPGTKVYTIYNEDMDLETFVDSFVEVFDEYHRLCRNCEFRENQH